ncbi:MAG: hypothetical protein U5N26_01130 [Candidatus Marinimicrobia bacterium]|nr:hypothetical protein [Candidatus Neomarinimicrobiota bacterium]
MIHLLEDGKLSLKNMITHRFDLDHINDGINTLRMGQTIRTVIYPFGLNEKTKKAAK